MSILKLKPCCKDYLWGGRRLADEYGISSDQDILAEAWVLSCHPDGPSVIVNGPHQGKTLARYLQETGPRALGTHCRRFRDFPILIKFIDARQNLSVQVHPGNRYALAEEHQYGKTEMWYVMDAGPDAFLYYGFKREISKEEFARRIREDTLLEVLNAVPVQKGDVLFIEAGTIHAIGAGILIAEIQQNSNVTYRVYDYGRVDKDGKKRDLHIEKALAVTNRAPVARSGRSYPHAADCDYFTVDKLNLDGGIMRRVEGAVGEESFASILILSGAGEITCGGEAAAYRQGDSFFLPAGSGAYTLTGSCDALITTVRGKTNLVRAGIDIGGRYTKVGLVDEEQRFAAYRELPFDSGSAPEKVIREAGDTVLALLEERHIDLDQCAGVGVGAAGIVEDGKGGGGRLYSPPEHRLGEPGQHSSSPGGGDRRRPGRLWRDVAGASAGKRSKQILWRRALPRAGDPGGDAGAEGGSPGRGGCLTVERPESYRLLGWKGWRIWSIWQG